MATDKPSDLHYTKRSHFSIPMEKKDMEWHFQNGDVADKGAKMGDKRIIVTPVEVTSKDKDGTRYRQIGPAQAPPPLKLPKGISLRTKHG